MEKEQKYLRRSGCLFITALLFIVLLAWFNAGRDASSQIRRVPASENSVIQISATATPSFQMQVLQKSWISNQGRFRILSFGETQHSESRLAHQKIELINSIRRSFALVPVPLMYCHLYPAEKEYPPVSG